MVEKIMIAVLAGSFCSLVTGFIAMLLAPKYLRSVVKEEIEHHELEHHKIRTSELIKEHTNACLANGTIVQIRDAVLWLVMQQGGNPQDLGLTK